MPTFPLREFLGRSTGSDFDEDTLAKVLARLPKLSEAGPWLGGGALRRVLLGQEPSSDFDFFFRSADQLAEFKEALAELGMQEVRATEHHVHFRGRIGDSAIERDVQCIRFAFYENAQAVIDSFDYTICQLAFDGEVLTCGEYTLWDLGRRRLAIHKITYPVSTMRRMLKYTGQGFTACAGCMASILRETAMSPQLMTQLDVAYVD